MRRTLLFLFLLPGIAAAMDDLAAARATLAATEQARCDMLAEASAAVVCIFADPKAGGGGSGVVIDPRGYGLTNFHVVQEFVESRQGFGGMNDGRLYPLRVIGIDAGGDIALFKLQGRDDFPVMPLADSDELVTGQAVAALGNPFILAEDFHPTITYGVISGLHRYQEGQGNLLEYADCIQVSTSINPGNSGGPLIDLQGRLIGINGRASFEERGRVNVGLGYAVTINQIKRFLPALRAGRFVEHGTLGLSVRSIGDKLVVQAIQDLSPAEKAGIELGDELLAVDGQPLRTANEFNNAIAILPANWPVDLTVRRGEETIAATVRLERLPLKVGEAFLPDLADNHAALRELLQSARKTLALTVDPVADWCWELQWDAPATWCTRPAPARPTGLDPVAAKAEWEFIQLAQPLIREPELNADWEWIGGDRVNNAIAAVVQHAPDQGPRTTWRLRYEDGAVLDVRIAYNREQVVHWRPLDPKVFAAGRWPSRWIRTAIDGSTQELTIEAFTRKETP